MTKIQQLLQNLGWMPPYINSPSIPTDEIPVEENPMPIIHKPLLGEALIDDDAILSRDEYPTLKPGDILVCVYDTYDLGSIGTEFEILQYPLTKSVTYIKYRIKNLQTGAEDDLLLTTKYDRKYSIGILPKPWQKFCKKEEQDYYQITIDNNKNISFKFKIKTSPSTGFISVWYTTNHPQHQDWMAVRSVKNQCDYSGNVYIFENIVDADRAMQWLQSLCKSRPWYFISGGGRFSKNWLVETNDWEDVK